MQTFLRTTYLALLLATGIAFAAEHQARFPTPKITVEQWKEYLAEVLAIPGIERRDSNRQITLTDAKTMTIYAFTQEANAAHPGVVVRILKSGPTGYEVQRIGHYAGDRDVFDRWWHEFDALDDRIRRQVAQ